jgi:hypothetical protein
MASTIPKVIANFETSLSAKLTTAGTSLTLTSATDSDGNALAAGTYAFTINEGKTNEEHVIGTLSGTTVSSLIRNLSRSDGTTAQTGKEHRKDSSIKITNHPALIRIIRVLQGIDGLDTASPLKYSSAPSLTPGSHQVSTVAYSESLANQGAATASTGTKGIIKVSTAPVDANNPIAVGDNDPRFTSSSGSAVNGTSNKFVDTADVATAATASKVVRRGTSGEITVPTTPSASTDAASKAYADSLTNPVYIPGLAIGIADSAVRVKDGATGFVDAVRLVDGATSGAHIQTRVPAGKTSISSIKVLYVQTSTGGNFVITNTVVSKLPVDGSAVVQDADSASETIAAGATGNRLYEITIPAARYSSISSVAAGDIISIRLQRAGADAADTYGGSLEVVGALITFA